MSQVIELLGYKVRATGHGFRHTMSTILHEKGFGSVWIEMQVTHVDKNTIRGTYNHAQYRDAITFKTLKKNMATIDQIIKYPQILLME